MMIEILGTITLVFAVTGVVLNNKLRIECFYLWLVSNALSAILHMNAAMWSLALRDLIFLVLAVHGIYSWRKLKRSEG